MSLIKINIHNQIEHVIQTIYLYQDTAVFRRQTDKEISKYITRANKDEQVTEEQIQKKSRNYLDTLYASRKATYEQLKLQKRYLKLIQKRYRLQQHVYKYAKKKQLEQKRKRSTKSAIQKETTMFLLYERAQLQLTCSMFQNAYTEATLLLYKASINNIKVDSVGTKNIPINISSLYESLRNNAETQQTHVMNTLLNELQLRETVYTSTKDLNNLIYYISDCTKNILTQYVQIQKMRTIIKQAMYHFTNSILCTLQKNLQQYQVFLYTISHDLQKNILKALLDTYTIYKKTILLIYDTTDMKLCNSTLVYLELYYRIQYLGAILSYLCYSDKKYTHKQDTISALHTSYYDILLQQQQIQLKYCLAFVVQLYIRTLHKQKIISHYLPFLSKTVSNTPVLTRDTLRIKEEGKKGIIEAIHRYSVNRGVRFVTYASWWLHKFIKKNTAKKK